MKWYYGLPLEKGNLRLVVKLLLSYCRIFYVMQKTVDMRAVV
ncbi:hypothetical protein Gbem_1722 [Citrifermentans bemidjiense Bem]|uniref:Uncharacterized protein n=1 Tax=Citrifermentans bemidjiense (strain ATCC BAA-1014 / DSM 16622 / JCM 12645 / Bem) TaxID=404380 RepID=B5E9J6_CITBB|nr:hypothetical protein Gbem_1722 [Citrifermentans bemidjiense Bem]